MSETAATGHWSDISDPLRSADHQDVILSYVFSIVFIKRFVSVILTDSQAKNYPFLFR